MVRIGKTQQKKIDELKERIEKIKKLIHEAENGSGEITQEWLGKLYQKKQELVFILNILQQWKI